MNPASSLTFGRQIAPLALASLAAAITVAAYLQALYFPFVSDDIVYIVRNIRLAELQTAGLWRLLIEPYNDLYEFLPLRDLSYWFDISLFGPAPGIIRLHNILLYVLCLPLVFVVTRGFWQYFRPDDAADAPWAAAAVTALFVLHPAHVEAVVWISGRKDMLSCLFSLLALWLALIARREQGLSTSHAVAALFALLAAMLSKATAVAVAPIIALLWLIFWRALPAKHRRNSLLLWPFAGLLMALGFVWFFTAGSMVKEPVYLGVEAITRMLAVLGSLARLAISPESRHFYYPLFEDAYLSYRVVLGVAVLVAAVIGLVVILRKNRSLEGFALISFLLLCMPYTQLLPFDTDSLVSDRFLALAVWPVALLIAALAWRMRPVYRAALLLAIALSWGFQTVERPRDWRSFETLVDADLRAYPGYFMPAAYKITSFQLPQGMYGDAERTANSITTPEIRGVMIRMVKIHYLVHAGPADAGKLRDAMALLWELGSDIRQHPDQTKWNSPVKNLWIKFPYMLALEWRALTERYPGDASVTYNAGMWLLDARRYHDAAAFLRTAVESPGLPGHLRGKAYGSLGAALMKSGRVTAAEAPLRAALEQAPPDLQAYCSFAELYKHTNRPSEAERVLPGCRSVPGGDAAP